MLKENGIAHKEHAYFKRTPHISRKTCLTIDGIDKFTGIINQNLKWEKITSIEESENEVFDLKKLNIHTITFSWDKNEKPIFKNLKDILKT